MFEAVFGLGDGTLVCASKDASRVRTVGTVARLRLRLGAKGFGEDGCKLEVWCKCNMHQADIKAVNREKCRRQHLGNIS